MCWCRVCLVERPRGAFHSFGSGRRLVWREHGPATFARAQPGKRTKSSVLPRGATKKVTKKAAFGARRRLEKKARSAEARAKGASPAQAAKPWQGKRAADAGKGPAKKRRKRSERLTFVGKRRAKDTRDIGVKPGPAVVVVVRVGLCFGGRGRRTGWAGVGRRGRVGLGLVVARAPSARPRASSPAASGPRRGRRLEFFERGRQVVGVVLLEPPRRLGRGRGAAARLARRAAAAARAATTASGASPRRRSRSQLSRRAGHALCAMTTRAALPHRARTKGMRYWCVAMSMASWAARTVCARRPTRWHANKSASRKVLC